jgi:REP element-mobilizing transposase RayT
MARLPRIVIPGLPHHVTQRGNRREAIFFEDGDQEIYLLLVGWPFDKVEGFVKAQNTCAVREHR